MVVLAPSFACLFTDSINGRRLHDRVLWCVFFRVVGPKRTGWPEYFFNFSGFWPNSKRGIFKSQAKAGFFSAVADK
jgi:hypothetical protein